MYYYFTTSSEPKVIGVRNGIYQAIFDKTCYSTSDGIKNYEGLFPKGKITQNEDLIKNVISSIVRLDLMKTAKLTDFLQLCPFIPNVGFLLSERLKNIFESCDIPNNFISQTSVLDKKTNKSHPYYFFYHRGLSFEDINLKKSELFSRNISYKDGEVKIKDTPYPIKNLKHYNDLRKSLLHSDFSKICISSKYKGLDFIEVYTTTFLSEKLKNKLEEAGITGIETGNRCALIFD